MKFFLGFIISLLCFLHSVSAFSSLSEDSKKHIDTLLESHIFKKLPTEKIDAIHLKLKAINISQDTSPKKQAILQYIKESFTKQYKIYIDSNSDLRLTEAFKNKKLQIPTLMFHYIEEPTDIRNPMRYSLGFSPKKLETLLQYLDENNIEALTFWDLKHILEGKKELPQKAIMLTFDDGHLDHYTRAFPLLKKYNKKAVFFIISGQPNNDGNFMNWEQIQEMEENGQEIAAHTVSHPDLTKLSPMEQESEIIDSKTVIEAHIERPIIAFSYPYGANNKAVRNIVSQHYLFARTTEKRHSFSTMNLHQIPTIHMTPDFSISQLQNIFGTSSIKTTLKY